MRRMYSSVPGPEKEKDVVDCNQAVASRTMELMDRITAYFGTCALTMGEEHASFHEEYKAFMITDEAQNLLCKDACKNHPDIVAKAPDSSALIEACSDHAAIRTIILLDAFDEGREACSSWIDLEANSSSNVGGKVEPSTKVVVQSAELPVESPKAPLKGNMVKQLTFQHEVKSALASVAKGECKTLKKAFKKCDYQRTGKVYIKQVDDMLDKLGDEKAEIIDLLKEIAKEAKKDPDHKPLTFKDWTAFKLGAIDAANCALEYATK